MKTIFLCRYLHDEALRREINDRLNVIEHWNGANDFVFFARRGELSSNRREDHELSMLSLHLLQNCMVYVNTLMVQQILARPTWNDRLTPRDLHALTPLSSSSRWPCIGRRRRRSTKPTGTSNCREGVIGVTRIADVNREWQEPSFHDFQHERNVWRLFNAVTLPSRAGRWRIRRLRRSSTR